MLCTVYLAEIEAFLPFLAAASEGGLDINFMLIMQVLRALLALIQALGIGNAGPANPLLGYSPAAMNPV